MDTLKDFQIHISNAVTELGFPLEPAELYEPIKYILALGGKRMRPVLLLMSCELFGGDASKAIKPALAIEVFHNFSLVHDDIMDKAPLRRGKATVHEKWNPNIAILSGDVMLVEAYKLIMQVEDKLLRQILTIFNNTAVGVCEGQQWDMNFETRTNVGIKEYLDMIRLKTAVLLGGGLKIGALIGGANENDAELICRFGEQMGIAFQLQDDILDVYGNPEKFGKQVGGDILSNKKTYLLIKALELATGQEAENLNYWLSAETFDATEKINSITAIYNNLNVKADAEKTMLHYADEGFKALEQIRLPAERKQYLHQFADSLLVRDN